MLEIDKVENGMVVNFYGEWIEIKSIKKFRNRIDSLIYREVYDLWIEDCHEYYANGLLVSNCVDGVRYTLEKFS